MTIFHAETILRCLADPGLLPSPRITEIREEAQRLVDGLVHPPVPWGPEILRAARRLGLPVAWVYAAFTSPDCEECGGTGLGPGDPPYCARCDGYGYAMGGR